LNKSWTIGLYWLSEVVRFVDISVYLKEAIIIGQVIDFCKDLHAESIDADELG
jgi:hypothetical protein